MLSLPTRIIASVVLLGIGVLAIIALAPEISGVQSWATLIGGVAVLVAITGVLWSRRLGPILARCVAGLLPVAAVWYLVSMLAFPPPGGIVWYSGSRSRPSVVNAVLFAVVFGVPGGIIAVRGWPGRKGPEGPSGPGV